VSASDNPYAADFLEQHFAEFVCYLVEAILPVILLFLLLAPKHRPSSRWVRSVFSVFVIILPVQSALGFLLLLYSEHFNRHTFEYLFQWKSQLNGIAMGLLISLFLSPEFRKLSRIPSLIRAGLRSPQGDLTKR
jgi:ABC-type sugar transport system permease subunit